MPVHPVLADLLERWRERGWPELMGRSPRPDESDRPNPARHAPQSQRGVSPAPPRLGAAVLPAPPAARRSPWRRWTARCRTSSSTSPTARRGTSCPSTPRSHTRRFARRWRSPGSRSGRGGCSRSRSKRLRSALQRRGLLPPCYRRAAPTKPPSAGHLRAHSQRGVRDLNPSTNACSSS